MTGSFLSAPRLLLLVLFSLIAGRVGAEDYLDYYRKIALAEQDAVTGNYIEALQKFDAAFRQYSYSNPVDVYVAAQLASYTGDTSGCAALLRRGLSFGLPIQTIRGNPHLAPFVDITGGMLTHQDVDSCWRVYQQRIDHSARRKAIALIQRDQKVIQAVHAAHESIYERDGYTLKAVHRPFWDSLLQEVIGITRTSGFPAQKIIGTMNGDDSLFRAGPNSVYVYYILIHHGSSWPQLGTMLWDELRKGNITPQMYGALEDNSNLNHSSSRQKYFALRPAQSKAAETYIRDHLAELNENRQRIGLCSYEVLEQEDALTRAYAKWVREKAARQEPVFDFKRELHFTGAVTR